MQHLASDLIDLARTLVDDDHEESPDGGWIAPERWLTFLNWELTELYWRLARMSLVQPALSETTFSGPSTTISARAVHSVGQDMGSYVRPLKNDQALAGSHHVWVPSTPTVAQANRWFVEGGGDTLTVELWPRDTASYKVRYAAPLQYLTAASQSTPDLPAGVESRIVYGMARHAVIKESGRSLAVEQAVRDADAFIGHLATQRLAGNGPRVINSRDRRRIITAQAPALVFP